MSLLSERLAFLRADKSKAEFARQIGVSAPLYHQWENGANPTAEHICMIAKTCNVSVQWLMGGEKVPASNGLAPATIKDGRVYLDPGHPVLAEINELHRQLGAAVGQARAAREKHGAGSAEYASYWQACVKIHDAILEAERTREAVELRELEADAARSDQDRAARPTPPEKLYRVRSLETGRYLCVHSVCAYGMTATWIEDKTVPAPRAIAQALAAVWIAVGGDGRVEIEEAE